MFFRLIVLAGFCLTTCPLHAQWSLQAGIGVANPISGYKTISKTGMLYQFDISKKLANNRWDIGLILGWGRMHKDNNSSDVFGNARLDQVPIVVNMNYELAIGKLKPYAGLGMGVSLYNLSYDISSTAGETILNASFSIMPRTGIRVKVNDRLFLFFEINAPFVMDGPPQGSGESEKATGYIGVLAGIGYRF